jgi:hypothetical protein
VKEFFDYIISLGLFWGYIILMFLICTIIEFLTSKDSSTAQEPRAPSESPK